MRRNGVRSVAATIGLPALTIERDDIEGFLGAPEDLLAMTGSQGGSAK